VLIVPEQNENVIARLALAPGAFVTMRTPAVIIKSNTIFVFMSLSWFLLVNKACGLLDRYPRVRVIRVAL